MTLQYRAAVLHAAQTPMSIETVTADRFSSDPLTTYPRFASSSAMPLMPIPPMPTKWTWRVLPSKNLAFSVLRSPFSVLRSAFCVPILKTENEEPRTQNV